MCTVSALIWGACSANYFCMTETLLSVKSIGNSGTAILCLSLLLVRELEASFEVVLWNKAVMTQ